MVFITHDLGIVSEFCDTVAVVYAGEAIERGTVEQVFAREVNHPYTQALFECLPDLSSTTARLPSFENVMIDPTRLPEGCKFAARCHSCTELCKQQNPALYVLEDGHSIKCHLFAEKEAKGK
jgi:peptide/nickel transport system ATP-binding protein